MVVVASAAEVAGVVALVVALVVVLAALVEVCAEVVAEELATLAAAVVVVVVVVSLLLLRLPHAIGLTMTPKINVARIKLRVTGCRPMSLVSHDFASMAQA